MKLLKLLLTVIVKHTVDLANTWDLNMHQGKKITYGKFFDFRISDIMCEMITAEDIFPGPSQCYENHFREVLIIKT